MALVDELRPLEELPLPPPATSCAGFVAVTKPVVTVASLVPLEVADTV